MYSNPSLLRSLPPTKVLEHLYCGNLYNAFNKKQLNELNIECILNLRSEISRNPLDHYLHCPLDDFGKTNLDEIFSTCLNFIESALLNKKNILVHCDGGINRAPSIIIAYLIVKEKWTAKTALAYLMEIRPCISPRENYIRQLRELEIKIRGEDSLDGIYVETQEVKCENRNDILRKYRVSVII
jgi:protein-tyrosine phosphatase